MQLVSSKVVMAMFWASLVSAAGIAAGVSSRSSWTALAGVALLPAIVMMWRWDGPPQTMSESIQEALR